MGIGYVILAGNDEYQMVLTLQNDRFLWFWLGDHFLTITLNLVHVVSNSEMDLQIVKFL